VEAATDNLSQTPLRGITTMVSTLGTVDLTHISRTSIDPADIAQTAINSVIQLAQFAAEHQYTFIYLVPGYIQCLTFEEYNTFVNAVETSLKSHEIPYMKIADIMIQLSTPIHTTCYR